MCVNKNDAPLHAARTVIFRPDIRNFIAGKVVVASAVDTEYRIQFSRVEVNFLA